MYFSKVHNMLQHLYYDVSRDYAKYVIPCHLLHCYTFFTVDVIYYQIQFNIL